MWNGIWCMVKGGNFLDYNALNRTPGNISQYVGVYLLKQESVLPCSRYVSTIFYWQCEVVNELDCRS